VRERDENKVSLWWHLVSSVPPHLEVSLLLFGGHRATTSQGEMFVVFGEHYAAAPLQWRLASFGSELWDTSSSPLCLGNSYLSSTTYALYICDSHRA
jgi:hypothetical protein